MKRSLALLGAAGAVAALLTACGQDANGVPSTEVNVAGSQEVTVDGAACTIELGGKLKLEKVAADGSYQVKLEVPKKFKNRKLLGRKGMCTNGSTFTIASSSYLRLQEEYEGVDRDYDNQFAAVTTMGGSARKKFEPTGELAEIQGVQRTDSRLLVRMVNPGSLKNADTTFGFWSTCAVELARPAGQGSASPFRLPVVHTYTDSLLESLQRDVTPHKVVVYQPDARRKPAGRSCPVGTMFLADDPYSQPNMDLYAPKEIR
jgi:hypothetical protein